VLSTHVVVDESASKDQVLCVKADIKRLLKKHGLSHLTIEIEYGEADCAMAS
jgi:Co/Zn/Cd efflux system component